MLQGKLAFITGASQGIGKAIALKFAEEGADLIITGRNEEKLIDIASEIEQQFSVNVFTFSADLSDPSSVKKMIFNINKLKRPLDVVVNNAGMLHSNMLGLISRKEIEEQFEVNVFSLIQICQLTSRMMMRHKKGSIINMSSIMGVHGAQGVSAYSSSKAAILGFSKSLAKELAIYNIRVNTISPGFIDTDMTQALSKADYEKRVKSICLGKAGQPENVADAALFLASGMSSYITGQNIGVDGGMVI